MVTKKNTNAFTSEMVRYLLDEYFGGEHKKFIQQTGCNARQLNSWLEGITKPQKATLRWLLSCAVAPEFKVVCEYSPVNITAEKEVSSTLKKLLGADTDKSSGIYAFYDSMCNVIYVGKTVAGLQKEIYQQLKKPLGVAFPKAIRSTAPKYRWQATRYISAYEIPDTDHLDYPKHVEALILRVSKPVSNKILGTLKSSRPQNLE